MSPHRQRSIAVEGADVACGDPALDLLRIEAHHARAHANVRDLPTVDPTMQRVAALEPKSLHDPIVIDKLGHRGASLPYFAPGTFGARKPIDASLMNGASFAMIDSRGS